MMFCGCWVSTCDAALKVATGILDPRPEALEKMSQILVSTLGGTTGTTGSIVQNKAELERAANLLDQCLNLAIQSPEAGVGSMVAISMLEALSTFNEGGRLGSLGSATEEALNYTEKMATLASKLASAAHAKLLLGDSKFLSGSGGSNPPSGVNLQLISSRNADLRLGVRSPPFVSRISHEDWLLKLLNCGLNLLQAVFVFSYTVVKFSGFILSIWISNIVQAFCMATIAEKSIINHQSAFATLYLDVSDSLY